MQCDLSGRPAAIRSVVDSRMLSAFLMLFVRFLVAQCSPDARMMRPKAPATNTGAVWICFKMGARVLTSEPKAASMPTMAALYRTDEV